jgi:predicted nucleic acid-binding protein
MAAKVVDASALCALLFGESTRGAVQDQLQGAVLIAPPLLALEVANVCLTKIRLHPDLEAFALRGQLVIETADVDHSAVIELAQQAGLSTYDASYLYLAKRYGAQLVSLDRRLLAAAARRGG